MFRPAARASAAAYRFNAGRGGRRVVDSPQPLAGHMPSYQYYFVVLAERRSCTGTFRGFHSIKPPGDLDNRAAPATIAWRCSAAGGSSLPSHANQWTSIACVLWDDASPTALDPAQQQAMLDWLHWGGQLILSGPDTLDGLRDSFLAPYLPAIADGNPQVGQERSGRAERAFRARRSGRWRRCGRGAACGCKNIRRPSFCRGRANCSSSGGWGGGESWPRPFDSPTASSSTGPAATKSINAFLLRRPPRKYVEGERRRTAGAMGRRRPSARRGPRDATALFHPRHGRAAGRVCRRRGQR